MKSSRYLKWAVFLLLCIPAVLLVRPSRILSQEPDATAHPPAAPAAPTPTPIQPTNLHQWGAITLFHGLPSNRVRAIAQTHDGTIWFGTDSGLARYDGRRTQTVAIGELPTTGVLSLACDASGMLWVGTDGGAARMVKDQFVAVAETVGKSITAIIAPSNNRVVMASAQGMLFDCEIRPDSTLSVITVPVDVVPGADSGRTGPLYLTSLAVVGDRLIVGTRGRGIMAVDNGKPRELELKPRAFFVEALTVNPDGQIVIGARSKTDAHALYRWTGTPKDEQSDLETGPITSFAHDSRGNLWVGADGRGAFHEDGKGIERFTFEGTAGGLTSNHVYAIFVDTEGVVWFGTDRGVCRYDQHAPRAESVGPDPETNFVRSLAVIKDGPLLAGTNRGLFVSDAKGAGWKKIEALGRNSIYAIAQDSTGRLMLGTSSGLYLGERRSIESGSGFVSLTSGNGVVDGPGSVRAITRHGGDVFIASFGKGIERLVNRSTVIEWSGDPGDPKQRDVISLSFDGDTWLIGTAERGLYFYDGKHTFQDPTLKPIEDASIRAVRKDSAGRLWLATSRGLFVKSETTLVPVVTGIDVRALEPGPVQDNGLGQQLQIMFAATSGSGLVKAFYDEHLGTFVSRIDAEQGLPSQSAFALTSTVEGDNETLIIGTNRGIARLEPAPLSPRLASVQVVGKRVYQPEEIENGLSLEYPQNSFVLDVRASSTRTFPEQFQYLFQLLDANNHVLKQKVGRDPQFAIEGLKSGNFQVRAIAYSRDLVPSAPLRFNLAVAKAPFPWTSTSLAVLLGLALIALWWGYRQNARIRRTSKELTEAHHQLASARMDLANEAETERRRIARDLHDQTLADLRNLMMLSDELGEMPVAATRVVASPAVIRTEIENISAEIRRICEDLSPSVLENVGLAAALEWALSNTVTHSPPGRRFIYEVDFDDDLTERAKFAPGVAMQVYRVAQEIINNIGKHSGAARVWLSARVRGENFELVIEHDGKSFRPRDVKRGRGITNILSRATMIEADVQFEKRDGGGMRFSLTMSLSTSVDPPLVPESEIQ